MLDHVDNWSVQCLRQKCDKWLHWSYDSSSVAQIWFDISLFSQYSLVFLCEVEGWFWVSLNSATRGEIKICRPIFGNSARKLWSPTPVLEKARPLWFETNLQTQIWFMIQFDTVQMGFEVMVKIKSPQSRFIKFQKHYRGNWVLWQVFDPASEKDSSSITDERKYEELECLLTKFNV